VNKVNKQIAGGIFWRACQSMGQQSCSFVIGIVMARLLGPTDFGLFAIVYFFVTILEVFSDGGMGLALVQKREVDRIDYNTVLYFNIAVSTLCAVALALVAPWIAEFYHQPMATPLLRVIGLKIIIDSLGTVQFAQLRRELRFRAIALSNICSIAVGGGVGIGMAFAGFGVWSLIGQQLTLAIVLIGIYWIIAPWRPRFIFSRDRFWRLGSFGGGVLFSHAIGKICDNIYTVIIGRVFSSEILGFFNRSQALYNLSSRVGFQAIGEGAGPVLYRLQDDDARLRESLSMLLGYSSFILFPLMFGMAAVAQPLVVVLLTAKWLPSVPFLRILAFGGIFLLQNYYTMTLLKIKGKIGMMIKLEIFKRALLITVVLISSHWGMIPLLWSGFGVSFVVFFVNCNYCRMILNWGLKWQWQACWKILLAAGIMGGSVYMLMQLLNHLPAIVQLLLGGIFGVALYWLLAVVLHIGVYWQIRRQIMKFVNDRLRKDAGIPAVE